MWWRWADDLSRTRTVRKSYGTVLPLDGDESLLDQVLVFDSQG